MSVVIPEICLIFAINQLETIDFFDKIADFIWEIVDYLINDFATIVWNDIVGELSTYIWGHMTLTLVAVLLIGVYSALNKYGADY